LKKIVILGTAPASMRLAPFNNQDWDIWACSPGTYGSPRITKFFELHRWEPGQPWFSEGYCNFLRNFAGPVMMAQKVPEVKNCVVLPWRNLVKKYGPYFFTSSIAWMMAEAIEEIQACGGEGKIALYGVDMAAACLSGDIRVLTSDLRWVRCDSVEIGDELIAFDEHSQPYGDGVKQRRWKKTKVLRNDRLTKPSYKVTLEDGREIICSEDHLWLTYGENTSRWKHAKDLVTSNHREDRPTRIIDCIDVWDEDRSWDAGYLAAAFDGEGYVSQTLRNGQWGHMRIGFSQRDNEMLAQVIESLTQLGYEFKDSSITKGINGGVHNLNIRGGRAEQMKFLGNIRPRRLLGKFDPDTLGIFKKRNKVAVVKTEFIGDYPVIGLKTDTSTFIAEGLASHNSEYTDQRLGCQFFAMLAKSMGIEVGVPPESDLFRPAPLYGICETSHAWIKQKSRAIELNQRLAECNKLLEEKRDEKHFLQGALDDQDWHLHSWFGNEDSAECTYVEPPHAPVLQLINKTTSVVLDDSVMGQGDKNEVYSTVDIGKVIIAEK